MRNNKKQLYNQIMESVSTIVKDKLKLNETQVQSEDYKWYAKDFYDNHCILYNTKNEFMVHYDIHFIDNDFGYDKITVTDIHLPQNDMVRPRLITSWIGPFLMNNYYDEVQNGYIKSIFDEQQADFYKDEYVPY